MVEKDFRAEFIKSVTDEGVRYFWENEYELLSGKPSSSILIRLDAFLRQSMIRNIVCQKDNKLDVLSIMDRKKILLIKLSQGLIGEENAYLLGTMLVSRIYQSALSRQDSHDRPYFWLYLDEFHHFITPSMERILAGTRKYNLGLVLAHQEFRQMQARSQEVASSVLSNCYTRICFRLGDADSSKFADGFSFFDSKGLQNLGIGEAIVRVERADFDFNLSVTQVGDVPADAARRRREAVVAVSKIDVALERDDLGIACEVANTNSTGYEVLNIQKCLMAGFDRMVVISPDARHLKNIRGSSERILPYEYFERVHFLEPQNFHLFLQSFAHSKRQEANEAETVLGYRVVARTPDDDPKQEVTSKKSILRDLISRVTQRKKNKPE